MLARHPQFQRKPSRHGRALLSVKGLSATTLSPIIHMTDRLTFVARSTVALPGRHGEHNNSRRLARPTAMHVTVVNATAMCECWPAVLSCQCTHATMPSRNRSRATALANLKGAGAYLQGRISMIRVDERSEERRRTTLLALVMRLRA